MEPGDDDITNATQVFVTVMSSCIECTCLHQHLNYVDVVRLLIEHGADMEKATKYGQTPLTIACQEGQVDVVRLLIDEHGAAVESFGQLSTPPMIACYGCRIWAYSYTCVPRAMSM
jgi:ankyrin repeat protein